MKKVKLKNNKYLSTESIVHGNKRLDKVLGKFKDATIKLQIAANQQINANTYEVVKPTMMQKEYFGEAELLKFANNKVVIGKGFKLVRISYSAIIEQTTASIAFAVQKNGNTIDETRCYFPDLSSSTRYRGFTNYTIKEVQEGDIFELVCWSTDQPISNAIINLNTFMIIETIK